MLAQADGDEAVAAKLGLLEALAHEVRTPLATIRTLIRSLQRRGEFAECRIDTRTLRSIGNQGLFHQGQASHQTVIKGTHQREDRQHRIRGALNPLETPKQGDGVDTPGKGPSRAKAGCATGIGCLL